MRNEKSKCNCGHLICDMAQDFRTMHTEQAVFCQAVVDLLDEIADPRRDSPRLKSVYSYVAPTSDGLGIDRGAVCELLDVSQETMESIVSKMQEAVDNAEPERPHDIEVFVEFEYQGDVVVLRSGQKEKIKG